MFLSYCSYACRAIVLLAVVFILGYVLLANQTKKIESFTTKTQDDLDKYESIRTVFKTYLFRDPTNDEYKELSSKMINAGDLSTLIAAIKEMQEYKQYKLTKLAGGDGKDALLDTVNVFESPLTKELSDIDAHERLKVYKDVISVYNKVLDRVPNPKELSYYAYKILKDKDFTLLKLEQLLSGSKEYKILESNQTNVVNAELSGNITEAQIQYEIRRLYKSVFNASIPNKEFEEFLKQKYIEYHLNDAKIVNLLLLIKNLDENKFNSTNGKVDMTIQNPLMKTDVGLKGVSSRAQSESANQVGTTQPDSFGNISLDDKSNPKGQGRSRSVSNVYQSPNIINIINPTPEELNLILGKIDSSPIGTNDLKPAPKAVPACYQKNLELYTDPFTLALMKGDTCSFKPNEDQGATDRERNVLSEALQKRNMEDVRNSCKRTTYFLQKDGELQTSAQIDKLKNAYSPASYDEYTQFGTPLDLAKNTYVGSIMPPFSHQEFK
jgi:hypothetical protein